MATDGAPIGPLQPGEAPESAPALGAGPSTGTGPSTGAGPSVSEIEQLIAGARAGCGESLGQLIERCRQYLLLIANSELDEGLQSKVGASDVVQETLLTAQQAFARFQGASEGELRLWLRQILVNRMAHTWRAFYQVSKRDLAKEQQLVWSSSGEAALDVVDDAPTPCRAAMAKERAAAVERALERLPNHYRQVIAYRSFDRKPFGEIGILMQVSAEAARKLWCRAVDELRREWETSDESP